MSLATRPGILPTGSTELERAVDQYAPRWGALADGVATPGDNLAPSAFAPWLATEWGLAPFARYFDSIDALIDAAHPWLLERGTPNAVKRALSWIGFTSAQLDEDGPWLHINLGRTADNHELAQIAHLVRASVPAHVHFYRVYWAHDQRMIRLDARPVLDFGVLDDESGVSVDIPGDEPIIVSFGLSTIGLGQAPRLQPIPGHLHMTMRGLPIDPRLPRLDSWSLDSAVQLNAHGSVVTHWPYLAPKWSPPYAPLLQAMPVRRLRAPHPQTQTQGLLAHRSCSVAPRPVPTPRSWTGTWDTQPWATSLPYRITTHTH